MANENVLDLLRLLLWEGNVEFYSDCESANISVEQAFRDSLYMGTDGLPVLLILKGNSVLCIKKYLDYKERVLTDGGIIEDEDCTREFICSLF